MKTKFLWVALLASAALIGQAQGDGYHDGGGGFSGGGRTGSGGGRAGPVGGGGGLRGGGFHAVAPVIGGARRSFGVGARGGGVGFGMSRYSSFGARPLYRRPVYYNGRVGRSVTPSIGARTAVSQPQNRFSSIRNPVGQRPAVAFNRAGIASAARSPGGTAAHRGLNGRTDHIAERHDANWHHDWDRRHAHFFHNRFFVFDNGFWCGLDTGFFPWDYLPYYAGDYYPYDYYTDVQPDYSTATVGAYPYGYYTGVQPADNTAAANGAPVTDATVEATQERLAQLGYYNGPVDGIFGPTTRDAVAKYQIDNQLDVTGSLSPDTLESLGVPPTTDSDR
jgi:Putative peptidoglycan binding domain